MKNDYLQSIKETKVCAIGHEIILICGKVISWSRTSRLKSCFLHNYVTVLFLPISHK